GQSVIALAGTRNGLFRTPSGRPGKPWIQVSEFGHEDVTAIAWSGEVAYAASGGSGSSPLTLRSSGDGGGRTWASISHALPRGVRAVKLADGPANGNDLRVLARGDPVGKGRKRSQR